MYPGPHQSRKYTVRCSQTPEWVRKRHIHNVELSCSARLRFVFVWAATGDLCLPASVRPALSTILLATLLTTETLTVSCYSSLFPIFFAFAWSPNVSLLSVGRWASLVQLMGSRLELRLWECEPLFSFPFGPLLVISRGLTLERQLGCSLCCAAQWRVHNPPSCATR